MTMDGRRYAWEKSYPEGVRWDAPIATSTLQELIDGAVAAFDERTAFSYRDFTLTYRTFAELAARAAAGLVRLGIGRDDGVALLLPNTPYHPVGFFAILRAGARVVHLSPLDAERELVHKLRDSGARTLITTNMFGLVGKAERLLAAGHVDRIVIGDDDDWGAAASPPEPFDERTNVVAFARLLDAAPLARWPQVTAEDVALLQYTGATTGLPKAAMLTHANLTAAVSSYKEWIRAYTRPGAGPDRVIMVLPLFHIYGLCSVMLRHLACGNELMLRTRFDVEAVLRDIEIVRATAFPGVPTMWIALANHPGIETRDFSSLRVIGSGGAPLPIEVAQRVQRITGRPLPSGWGMTETSPAGISPPANGLPKPGTIGIPLPGITVEVVALDDPRRVLGVGEAGELRIKGLNVMQGYWNRPQETAAVMIDGWFLTGDIGIMDEDGYFFLVERKNDVIISGGFNVYPVAIEHAIYEHPDIEEALVIGVPDAYRGEAAKAFVKLKRGARPLTLDALRDFLADKLGRHELPTALDIRANLPRTAAGKFARRELVEEEREKSSQDRQPALTSGRT
jgi:long-chain acyl-CoA synthetase